jgi:hypothetical protein
MLSNHQKLRNQKGQFTATRQEELRESSGHKDSRYSLGTAAAGGGDLNTVAHRRIHCDD